MADNKISFSRQLKDIENYEYPYIQFDQDTAGTVVQIAYNAIGRK